MNFLLAATDLAQQSARHAAENNIPGWLQVLATIGLGLASGFAGGWVVAFKEGGWREKIKQWLQQHDQALDAINDRLDDGDVKLDNVPTLKVRLNAIKDAISDIKSELQYQRENFVHIRECKQHREDKEDGEK